MSDPDGLKSLYGNGHANATRTRECVAMPGLREQSIYTPASIMDAVRACWGGVVLDPCSSNDPAREGAWVEEKGKQKWIPGAPEPNSIVQALQRYTVEDDGLAQPWQDGTFWNPPYGKLRLWVEKEAAESKESIGLIPNRSHRRWLDLASYDLVCFLDPLKFYDHKQAAPFPMLVVYRGNDLREFTQAFDELGRVRKVIL